MVDIHVHILPGLDDGARDYETGVVMAQMAEDAGVTDIIVTPHANQRRRFENYASEDLDDRLMVLRAALRHADVAVRLHPGMEVYGTPDLPKLLREGKVLTLAGSRYLLVEFSFREDPAFMDELLHRLLAEGVVPVVAHPERYRALCEMPDVLLDWVSEGIRLQVNKGSLNGRFGQAAQYMSHLILENGLASVIASDAHDADYRTTDLSRVLEYLTLRYSRRIAERLLIDNPTRILRDLPLLSVGTLHANYGQEVLL